MKLYPLRVSIFLCLAICSFFTNCAKDQSTYADLDRNYFNKLLSLRDSINLLPKSKALEAINSIETSKEFKEKEGIFFLEVIKKVKANSSNDALAKLLDLTEDISFVERHPVNRSIIYKEISTLLSLLGNSDLAEEHLNVAIEHSTEFEQEYNDFRCDLAIDEAKLADDYVTDYDEFNKHFKIAELICSDIKDIDVHFLKSRVFRREYALDSSLVHLNKAIRIAKRVAYNEQNVVNKKVHNKLWSRIRANKVSLLYMFDDQKRGDGSYKDSINNIINLAEKERHNGLMSAELYNSFIVSNLNSLTKLKEYDKVKTLITELEDYYDNSKKDHCFSIALLNMSNYVLARTQYGEVSPEYKNKLTDAYNFMDSVSHHNKAYFNVMWTNVFDHFIFWEANSKEPDYEATIKWSNQKHDYLLARERDKYEKKIFQLNFWKERERAQAKKINKLNQDRIVQTNSKLTISYILLFSLITGLAIFYFMFKKIRKQKDELKQKTKILENFAFIAAHDLKAPLASISTVNEIISGKYAKVIDAKDKHFFDYITQSTENLKNMVNTLINISKSNSTEAGITANATEVNLNKVSNSALKLLQEDISKSKAKVSSSELPMVSGDESLLTELFLNLFSNAVKFSKKETPLEISVDYTNYSDNQYCITVRDNGIGISNKSKDGIFEMYKQDNDIDKFKGLGLGLYICKEILKLHNGEIWVESEKDIGSTFYFTLKKFSE